LQRWSSFGSAQGFDFRCRTSCLLACALPASGHLRRLHRQVAGPSPLQAPVTHDGRSLLVRPGLLPPCRASCLPGLRPPASWHLRRLPRQVAGPVPLAGSGLSGCWEPLVSAGLLPPSAHRALRACALRHLGTFGDSLARLPDRSPLRSPASHDVESFDSAGAFTSLPRIVPSGLAPSGILAPSATPSPGCRTGPPCGVLPLMMWSLLVRPGLFTSLPHIVPSGFRPTGIWAPSAVPRPGCRTFPLAGSGLSGC
jgi:hypothetical protein